MEIMTEAHKLVPGDLCDMRVLHGAGATAIPASAEAVCAEFPVKDRVRIVFASIGTVTMPSQHPVSGLHPTARSAPWPDRHG